MNEFHLGIKKRNAPTVVVRALGRLIPKQAI